MFFVVLFLAAGLLGVAYVLKQLLPGYATAIQRSWLVRLSLFALVGLALTGLALVPLPNKHRLVALVPIFFLVTAVIRIYKSGRQRTGLAKPPPPDIDRMKRLN